MPKPRAERGEPHRGGGRNALAMLVCVAALVAACSGQHHRRPTSKNCTTLRDHLVDLELNARRSRGLLSDKHLAEHRKNLERALGKRFIRRCVAGRSGWNLSCALAAKTKAGLASCSGKKK